LKHDTVTALVALVGFIFFSAGDVGIKVGSAGLSTFQAAATVLAIGLIPALLHMWHQGAFRNPLPNRPRLTLILSATKLCQIPCVFYAFATMPMALVYSAVFAMPLATNALNALILGEDIGPRRILAICAGFVGVIIALDPAAITFEVGHLVLLGIPLFGAIGNVVVRVSAKHEAISVMTFWPNLIVAIILGLVAAPDYQPMPTGTLLILSATSLCAWIGALCYMHALRRGPVVSASAMQYSQVIWGGLLGWFFFNEAVTNMTIIGSSIIVIAGLYVMLRSESATPQPTPTSPTVKA
jgi:S-adenosylmethionine uptake transporter